jgi:ribonuclease T2
MSTYWKDYQGHDENFWEHEWSKHGTCISTLDTECYTNYIPQQEVVDFFNTTINLFKTLPTYETLATAGILPVIGKTYTAAQFQAPLQAMHGAPVMLRCKNGALNEAWYHFDVLGSVQTGQFVAAEPNGVTSNCPSTGIKYLPKGGSPVPTRSSTITMTTTRSTIPSPTSAPFEGKGFLKVSCRGRQTGCLISRGAWYTSGTCAGFRAQADIVEADKDPHLFTLTSTKGPCGFINGRFECGKHLTTQSIFSSTEDGQAGTWKLSYRNQTTFYAANDPQKYEKVFLHSGKDEDHDLELEVLWSSSR